MEVDLTPFRQARRGEVRQRLTFPLPAGETPLGARVRLAEPATVAVTAEGGPAGVRVDVRACLCLVQPCDRCLEEVALTIPVAYGEEWRFAAEAGGAATDARGAQRPGHRRRGQSEADRLDADDDRVVRRGVGPGAQVLDDGFWQNVGLEIPGKVLCAEGCRGLCPHCGANRNRTGCACRPERAEWGAGVHLRWRHAPPGEAAGARGAEAGDPR